MADVHAPIPFAHRRTPNAGDTPAWWWLAAGVPLTLLLDLAAGDALDSRAILEQEQLAATVQIERAAALEQAEAAGRDELDSGIA